MMLDAVAFDLGCACSPLFTFSDASGLAPLTLPDEFLHGQSNQPQAELQPDTVRRFETAMSAESKLPPSVVESLMAHMSSGRPTVAGQEIESLKVKSSTVEGLEAAIAKPGSDARLQSRGTRDPAKCAGGFVIVSEVDSPKVKSPTVESLKVKNPTVEGLKVESQKSEVASVINPVSVERPMVVTVDTVVYGDSVVRSADEKLVVASPEWPKAPMIAASEKQIVGIEQAPANIASRPVVVSVDKSLVENLKRTTVATIKVPTVAMVESPVAVDRPIDVSVERSVRVAVEGPAIASVNSMIQEGSVVRSADERPMIATVERPMVESVDKPVAESVGRSTVVMVEVPTIATSEKPAAVVSSPAPTVAPVVLENPDDPVKVEGRPVVASSTPIASVLDPTATVETPVAVDKPIDGSVERSVRVAVEGPVAASVSPMIQEGSVVRSADEKPMAATVERPAVVAPDKPVFETAEKPVAIATPVAPLVVPAVQENPNDAVKAEGHPVVVSSTSIMPDALSTRPDVMVEAPVAVDKPIGASVEQSVQVIVPTPAEPTVIIEKAHPLSAERPVSAKIFQQTVATVDKPEGKESAASAHVVVTPTLVEVPSTLQGVQTAPEVAAASAASARTEAIVETVNQIVEAVVGQILITPGITHGECEIKIMLKPTVLDGSEITMSAKDGTLTVGITPATQAASAAVAAALPRLEIALAEHAPAFHHVSVALQLKKGNRNEAV